MRRLIVVLMIFLLTACASKPVTNELIYHPPKPTPVKTFVPNWVVYNIDGKSYVGMEYAESLKYRAWLERIANYIKTQNDIICVYRKDLKESECVEATE